jgi:hypothetical protein
MHRTVPVTLETCRKIEAVDTRTRNGPASMPGRAVCRTSEEPRSGVSEDEGRDAAAGACMVRDGAFAPPHHEGFEAYGRCA